MSVVKLANPGKGDSNFFQIGSSELGCCDAPKYDQCQYSVSYTDINDVQSIELMYEGEAVEVMVSGTSPKELRMSIAAALKTFGFDPYYEDQFRGIVVTKDQIIIIGEAEITKVNEGGTITDFDKKCESGKVCKYTGILNYDTDAGTVEGTQIGTTAGFAAGNAGAVQTALETALGAGNYASVTVEEKTDYDLYQITVHFEGSNDLDWSVLDLKDCGCKHQFVSA